MDAGFSWQVPEDSVDVTNVSKARLDKAMKCCQVIASGDMERDALSFLEGVSAFDFKQRLLDWTQPAALREFHLLTTTKGAIADEDAATLRE